MADRNFQATKPNSEICRMSLAILFTNGCYLMNAAILRRKHVTFLVSPSKYLSTPNKEIGQKLLPHSFRSTSWFGLVWNHQWFQTLKNICIINFHYIRYMHKLNCRLHMYSVYYCLPQRYIGWGETLNLLIFNLFSPSQIVSLSLYSICIIHRRCSRIDRYFSRTVKARRSWMFFRYINFNIYWVMFKEF